MIDKNSVERRIHFYRVDAGNDENGSPVQFDPTPALAYIQRLRPTGGLYWNEADGNGTFVLPHSVSAPQKLIVYRSRRSALPQVDHAAALQPLQLPDEGGLSEGVHVVFFPNNVAGADFNFYGPRMSRLAMYLRIKAADHAPLLTFEPLLRKGVEEQIRRMPGLSFFSFRVKKAYAEELRSMDASLGAALDATLNLGSADEIEIVLRPRPRSGDNLGDKVKDLTLRLLHLDSLRAAATAFKVKGYDPTTEQVELVDLLKDQLVARRRIIKQNPTSRALLATSAMAAIEDTYRDMRDEIAAAAGLWQ